MIPTNIINYVFATLSMLGVIRADIMRIIPYTQWTFDTPMEQIIFRENNAGFPIYLTIGRDLITHYDSLGIKTREISRTAGDLFQINSNHSAYMLLQEHESMQIENAERLYSFQVFAASGRPQYTVTHGVDIAGGPLHYSLTNDMSILLTETNNAWVLEMKNEDTLLFIESGLSENQPECSPLILAAQLKARNEMVTASSCNIQAGDLPLLLELQMWNSNNRLGDLVTLSGKLKGLQSLPGTDYYFLEIDDGYESTLTLFNRDKIMGHYPWKFWEIRPLGREAAFVISENDLNVVNLGDGTLISSYHPIDLSTISDATYLPDWDLFLYLRYEPYFTEDGEQAYRNFELEGVTKTGRIAHRSSFGTWTHTLPKISRISKDLFAIHIHNAVLVYRLELERN
ncbi:MAG: hypothetical protein HQ507_07420 [Candidatus Marinimicrobia bacterium]|nr:hypothetical protein [Candidatus Neomarinimicrobiota bacterium]